MINTFISTIKSNKYSTGIYTNKNFSGQHFNTNLLHSNNLWTAQYNSICTFDKSYMIWQYTETDSVDEINGYVDRSYSCLKSIKYDYNSNVFT